MFLTSQPLMPRTMARKVSCGMVVRVTAAASCSILRLTSLSPSPTTHAPFTSTSWSPTSTPFLAAVLDTAMADTAPSLKARCEYITCLNRDERSPVRT